MSNSIPVLRFLFRQDFKVLKEALNLAPRYEVIEFPQAHDLSTYLMGVPAALIMISLRDKEDMLQVANLIKLNKKLPKEISIKYVVINFSGDRNFEKAIAKMGIQEILDPNLNTKALKFKLDFWMKALTGQMKKNETAFNNAVKAPEINKTSDDKKPIDGAPIMSAPLELEDDIWLLKSENECRKVLGKWLVRIVGPGPYIGQWTELKSGLWRYDLKEDEKELYTPGSGAWFFSGDQKPDFIWKENNWLMTGESFELYYKVGEKKFSRLSSQNKVLTVCKNSLYAKTKEAFIIESFEKDIAFKKESDKLDNLSGDNSTDHLNGGPLSGKNTSPADKMGGNLSGNVSKTDSINTGPLSQNTSTSKEGSHWGGSVDPTQGKGVSGGLKGPASENPKAGSDLTLDEKNAKVQKHYKNHNTPEEFEAGKLLDMQAERAKQKDPLKGPAGEAVKEGSLLDLDIKDNHHQSHYKNATGAGHVGSSEKEKKASNYKEEGISTKQSSPASEGVKEGSELDLDQNSAAIDKFLKNKTGSQNDNFKKENKESGSENYGSEKVSKELSREEASAKSESQAEKNKSYGSNPNESERGSSTKGGTESWKQKNHSVNYESADSEDKSNSDLFDDSSATAKKPDLLEMAAEAQRKKKGNDSQEESSGNILPFNATEEKKMEDLAQDAQIKSVLIQKNKRINCRFDDFFDDTIIFSSTVQGMEESGSVTLDLVFKYKKEDNKLMIEGEVVSVDDDGEGNNYITIRVSAQNVLAFDDYLKLFQERQKNISEFLKTVKGL